MKNIRPFYQENVELALKLAEEHHQTLLEEDEALEVNLNIKIDPSEVS